MVRKAIAMIVAGCLVTMIAIFTCARILVSSISSTPPLGEIGTPVAFVASASVAILAASVAVAGLGKLVLKVVRRRS